MKKIPTLFKKQYDKNGRYMGVIPKYNIPIDPKQRIVAVTVKYDGTACAIIDGKLYKRYDVKPGRKKPEDAIFCEGYIADRPHNPSWIPCKRNHIEDKYYWAAYNRGYSYQDEDLSFAHDLCDGTYELIGKHIQNNPYNLQSEILVRHGADIVGIMPLWGDPTEAYNYFKDILDIAWIEGLVLWTTDEYFNLSKPIAKIRKKDFGFKWGRK